MSRLPSDSYTARRLDHATPEHLHLTTRRTFIGPIPEGWLNSHRKQWYRYYVQQGGRRAPTFTAARSAASHDDPTRNTDDSVSDLPPRPSSQSAETQTHSQTLTADPAATSTTSLLRSQRNSRARDSSPNPPERSHAASAAHEEGQAPPQNDGGLQQRPSDHLRLNKVTSRLQAPRVRFTEATKLQLRNQAQRIVSKGNFRLNKIKPGELMKMDKMLVRIDVTRQTIREDFDERVSQGVETKPLDKWREFMVACRRHEQGAVLQLYQTRVISSTADKTKKRPKAQIILNPHNAKINMFSSLDKTLCVWTQEKNGTYIYYLRPQSGASSVEWYTFLRGVVGLGRPRTLQINVPDMNITLRLDDPFRTLEASKALEDAAEGNEEALAKAATDEQGAAGAIVTRCVEMLKQSPRWTEVLDSWMKDERIGLAWKRYDRLEWVHGAVEQNMYGTIAMQRTHDLELRLKDHYPIQAKSEKGKTIEEPMPVEGFLVRLTTQQGHSRRMGKMLFKRLYFTSQDQYLIFLQPARARPPPPPKMSAKANGSIPSKKQLLNEAPLSYDVEPYSLDSDGQIAWLDTEGISTASEQAAYDNAAAGESQRNIDMLMCSEGFIDMCSIEKIRKFHKGAQPGDENLESGSDVEFNREGNNSTFRHDGNTNEVDQDRIFELVLRNGLVVRLQAYNAQSKKEWMFRLRKLVQYWHRRVKEDMDLFKSVRQQNLAALQIDERAEAQVGSFAYKWEVSQSYASPSLYNLCGIASCRPIHMSGLLFRKPRRRTTFTRCHVILSAGHLLIFQDTLRKTGSGKKLLHIHHERIAAIDLRGCYLYSGTLTEGDLLYQNRTFDSNMPGHHALPRAYLEDGWTSTDEDVMTTFVIWHAKSKSWFRSSHLVDDVKISERENSIGEDGQVQTGARAKTKTKLTRVSQLGVTGRSVVFKARSRAERDHWVLGVQVEIERLAAREALEKGEEIRLSD